MSKLSSIIFLLYFFLIAGPVAASRGTVEEGMLAHVASAMRAFMKMHGHAPTSWDEISTQLDLVAENQSMLGAYGYRFQDRYHFVKEPFPLFQDGSAYNIDTGSRVLLSRTIPFKDYRGSGTVYRSFVYLDSNGRIADVIVLEEKAQKLFKTYGITIPVPPGLPQIETNVNHAKSEDSGKLPDPTDAKRVLLAPFPSNSASISNSTSTVAAVGKADEPSRHPSYWHFGACIVATFIIAAWLFFRSKAKKGGRDHSV